MAKVHFDKALVEELLLHSVMASERAGVFGEAKRADGSYTPGLWLVGDHGIYLMSNGRPLPKNPNHPEKSTFANLIAFAEESNPEKDPTGFYDAKESIFGGDDGVTALPDTFIQRAIELGNEKWIALNINRRAITAVKPSLKE